MKKRIAAILIVAGSLAGAGAAVAAAAAPAVPVASSSVWYNG